MKFYKALVVTRILERKEKTWIKAQKQAGNMKKWGKYQETNRR